MGAASGQAGPQRQHRRGPVQRLDLGFLIHADHHRVLRRRQVQPHEITDLRLQLRVGGELERLQAVRLDAPLAPDPGHRRERDPQLGRQEPGRPVRDPQTPGGRPSVTVLALVILFAVYAFIAAGLQAARAFSSRNAGPVTGHLLLGLADLAAGVIALAWPGPTALVLVLIVGVWAVIAGLVEFSAAFASGEPAGTRAMLILGELVSIAFGVVLCARPGLGTITLALLFGLFNLMAGTWMLAQGTELPHTQKTLHSVRPAQPDTKAA